MSKAKKIHAGHAMVALARYFDWFRNTMMPEWEIDGGIADLLFVSRAGYVTEIEIKVTASDWNKDCDKDKWKRARQHIAMFYYAVPEALASNPPEWLPESAGILSIQMSDKGYPWVNLVRGARRMKAKKLPPEVIAHMHVRSYYRFWRSELDRRRRAMGL